VLAAAFVACAPSAREDAGPAPERETDAGPPVVTDVTITTSDGVDLDGTFHAPPAVLGVPTVLLLHQYLRDKDQWGDLPDELTARGYAVLRISLRGHGASDAYGGATLADLLTDPAGAPLDVDAAIAWLDDEPVSNADQIAIVGTSVGANLAVVAGIKGQGATRVAISARRPPSEALAGEAAAALPTTLFIAARGDPGGQAADSEALHGLTSEPRELHIYEDSSAHGVDLLTEQAADLEPRLFGWLERAFVTSPGGD
jgi:dienelactone hydrolase